MPSATTLRWPGLHEVRTDGSTAWASTPATWSGCNFTRTFSPVSDWSEATSADLPRQAGAHRRDPEHRRAGSVRAFDDEEGATDHAGQLRLLAGAIGPVGGLAGGLPPLRGFLTA